MTGGYETRLPLDNSRSEGALRKAALGRKNFLLVGHEAAGESLADLYALVATCEANGVNPEGYLADVLLRVQTHPNARIGELLPHEWKRLRAAYAS
ncbi:Mobile element protein [Corallococcus soli]